MTPTLRGEALSEGYECDHGCQQATEELFFSGVVYPLSKSHRDFGGCKRRSWWHTM